jgi:shikimate kinase
MKIFLIGLPGSGKSTLGKGLAQALKIPFVDLDTEIEKNAGRPISAIFEKEGEDYFRKLESEALKKWAGNPSLDFVMATGGGAPCFFDNMKVIKGAGRSIFLDVPATEIVRRINTLNRAKRPHFADVHPHELKDKVEFMRSSRLSTYKQADVIVAGTAIGPAQVLEKLNGGREENSQTSP